MQLPERIAQCRNALGMSQTQLGRHIGVEQYVISRMETGQRPIVYEEVEQLAKAFGLTVAEFLDFQRPVKAILILQEKGEAYGDSKKGS